MSPPIQIQRNLTPATLRKQLESVKGWKSTIGLKNVQNDPRFDSEQPTLSGCNPMVAKYSKLQKLRLRGYSSASGEVLLGGGSIM